MVAIIFILLLSIGGWAQAQESSSKPLPDSPSASTYYYLSHSALLVSELADLESHFAHVSRDPNAYEKWSPWLYGRHPSRPRMYGTMLGIHAGIALTLHYTGWERKKKIWIPVLVGLTIGHTIATIHNNQL